MTIIVSDKDLGWRRFMRVLNAPRASVSVGIVRAQEHPDSDLAVAELAAVHEFGSRDKHTPERSFIRSTFDARGADYERVIRALSRTLVRTGAGVASVLRVVGKMGAEDVKSALSGSIPPPNADSTMAQKGHGHTLLDSETMLNAISFRVTR